MWLLQSRNGCKRFFVGFFLHIYKKWYVCSKLQLELTNRNFMGIMWDSAWHVIIMENSNSYFKTILRGPTLTRSMDLLGRKVSLKFKGNFTSFHLLLNQLLLTFWLFVCVHALNSEDYIISLITFLRVLIEQVSVNRSYVDLTLTEFCGLSNCMRVILIVTECIFLILTIFFVMYWR